MSNETKDCRMNSKTRPEGEAERTSVRIPFEHRGEFRMREERGLFMMNTSGET